MIKKCLNSAGRVFVKTLGGKEYSAYVDRLGNHRKLGWEVLELRGPRDGHLTQNWETSILRMLKKRGADLSNSKIAGKFDGYSEAWSKTTLHATSIKELMRLTEEYEEGL